MKCRSSASSGKKIKATLIEMEIRTGEEFDRMVIPEAVEALGFR